MAKKTVAKGEEVEVNEWFEVVTFDPSRKPELLWLYETLQSLGVTQISQLEMMISRIK